MRSAINENFKEFSANGLHTLGVAYREVGAANTIRKEDEAQMTFAGFLLFCRSSSCPSWQSSWRFMYFAPNWQRRGSIGGKAKMLT